MLLAPITYYMFYMPLIARGAVGLLGFRKKFILKQKRTMVLWFVSINYAIVFEFYSEFSIRL